MSQKKSEQLGMPFGTAQNKLRKAILFNCIQRLGDDVCYRCSELIVSIDNLSIEHKIPWLDSDDPVTMFFDLKNISFSHLRCNIRCSTPYSAKGELNSHHKLTTEDAMAIRESDEKTLILATRYGVSTRTVRGIRSGQYWSHLGR